METKYTPEQIIEITIRNLNGINVPAGLTEQIGIPILQNINNLRECLKLMTAKPEEEPIDLGTIDLDEAEEKHEEDA